MMWIFFGPTTLPTSWQQAYSGSTRGAIESAFPIGGSGLARHTIGGVTGITFFSTLGVLGGYPRFAITFVLFRPPNAQHAVCIVLRLGLLGEARASSRHRPAQTKEIFPTMRVTSYALPVLIWKSKYGIIWSIEIFVGRRSRPRYEI